MYVRYLPVLIAVLLGGCVVPATLPDEPVPDPGETVDDVPDLVGPPADLPDPVPGACEILLAKLEETHPLLANVETALAGQADRIEDAIDNIPAPVAEVAPQDCPVESEADLGNKDIIGAIEWLYMSPPGQHYEARVDSGAETSSLSASNVVEFERDSEDWVRFSFQHDPDDDPIDLELPIKRTVLIRQPPAVVERRHVVEIDVRLGDELQTTEFTLTDRSSMTYPVLLGRAFLMDIYIVDVSRSYTHDRYEAP